MSPTSTRGRRRGRRPGAPDTRAAILAAARRGSPTHGYAVRRSAPIAAEAGVDPALVHHYFGTKDDLFLAALELPVDPREVLLPAIAAGGIDGAAERLLRPSCPSGTTPRSGRRWSRSSAGSSTPGGAAAARRLPAGGAQPVGAPLGIDRPELRMPLVASQMIGLILLRYVLGVEPLAVAGRARTSVATLRAHAPALPDRRSPDRLDRLTRASLSA